MFKIILHHLKRWFRKTDVVEEIYTESIDRLYTKGLVLLHRATSLSQLQAARHIIKKHETEVVRHNSLPWMIEQQDKLNKLWIQKYKLWKTRN
jgi:hypothetical protein